MLPTRMQGTQRTSSGAFVAEGTAACLYGYSIQHGDTSQSSVTFKDGGSSGTVRSVCSSVAGTASGDKTDTVTFTIPMWFSDGIYAALTGTDTAVCAYYHAMP